MDVTSPATSLSTSLSPSSSPSWTVATIFQSLLLFLLAGMAEIIGGWLIWMSRRAWNNDARAVICGAAILVVYGYIPTFQPVDVFARTYAVYGGVFIVLSYVWGMMVDGFRPDAGDVLGSIVALIGVLMAWFWPRGGGGDVGGSGGVGSVGVVVEGGGGVAGVGG